MLSAEESLARRPRTPDPASLGRWAGIAGAAERSLRAAVQASRKRCCPPRPCPLTSSRLGEGGCEARS